VLKASGTPVDELDDSLGFDRGDEGVDILVDNITSLHIRQQAMYFPWRIAPSHL
jgi:hypothetical protein